MGAILQSRCLNHEERQAVALCKGCRRFHCRECVTEHDDQVLCAACLKQLLKPAATKTASRLGKLWAKTASATGFLLGIFLIWLFFLLCGKLLLAIPTSFHDGTVWNLNTEDEP